jgi:uncharacterized protein (DUF1778 family)
MKTLMATTKDSMLHIRISSDDLDKIKQYASNLGMSQSEFCLNALLAAIGEDLEKPAMNNVLTRLAALERAVFQHSQAA